MESLIPCSCGRNHLPESMIPDPDRVGALLCPLVSHGVMRLTDADRVTSAWLLLPLFGEDL
jgi:hypothetical protein